VRVFDDVDEAILTELAAHAGLAMAISQARSAQLNAQRTRQEFTRLALHNLRTPLAVATGSALTLRRRYDDLTEPLREEMFDALIRSLERVERLAEESVLAGAELGGHEQRIEAALPRVLIERSLRSHEDLALQQQVTLVMSGDGTESAQPVRLDQKLLDVVLDNLVSNALKHSPPGGTVTVTWRCDDERLRIDVTDEGPGVPASEQGRIFEGFYRTSATMDAAIPGAGVGLAGTRRLLESLGGTIGVASQPGTGATFWATLPLAPSD
jgi:signal transduction histidine kinase